MKRSFYGVVRLLMLCALMVHLHQSASQALAQLSTVEVSADQRVSVAGRAASLKTVVEDVCWRAGVSVDFYDAQDRPFGGTYRDLPLGDLLGRLLSRESYMAGSVRDPATGKDRLLWLRVLGDPATAAARRASSDWSASRAGFQVPPVLLQTALSASSKDSSAKEAALASLAARISGDARQFEGFLATDSRLIAEAIARFDRAAESLRELRSRYRDPRVTAKIDEILAALARPDTPR